MEKSLKDRVLEITNKLVYSELNLTAEAVEQNDENVSIKGSCANHLDGDFMSQLSQHKYLEESFKMY